MKSLGRNKFLSIMQSHLICEAPLKDFDLNYIFIPSLIIKDGNETYYSDLHYRETSYMEYDRPSPTVEFDFRFEYKEHIIEEFNVYQRRVSFNNNMQNYKDTIFYSKEINDMYLIFYKNRRHYSREIFDVSIYYNLTKVMELSDFCGFCESNMNLDFRNFSYKKLSKDGTEAICKVVDFVEHKESDIIPELHPTIDNTDEKEIEYTYNKDYEKMKLEYCRHDKQIRKNIQNLLNVDSADSNLCPLKESLKAYHILGEDEILEACRIYEANRRKDTLVPPIIADYSFELSPNQIENDKCFVFNADGEIIDFIRLGSAETIEWDKNQYHRASFYADECRFIKIDSTTYDLLNPEDILRVPVKSKSEAYNKDLEDIYWFTKLIDYDLEDMRLNRLNDEERERFDHFWTNEIIDGMVAAVRTDGIDTTEDKYFKLALSYCDNNSIVLSLYDIRAVVQNYLSYIEKNIINQKDTEGDSVPYQSECEPENSEMDKLEAFWTDIDVLSIGKMVSREGKATVIKRYIGLVQDYCKNNKIHLTDSEITDYIEELVDSVSGDLFTISTEINDECDDFGEFADSTTDENELMELIVARAKSCFERALLGPLAYLAVKIALYQNRDFYDFERIVAQMVANGENEYGEYLDQYLSKVANEWNSKDSVAHGRSLVGWATNYREYKWLVAFFPEVAPKSKRKYISFKKNNTKEYVKLKELAKGKGYDLDDDAWKTDIYR